MLSINPFKDSYRRNYSQKAGLQNKPGFNTCAANYASKTTFSANLPQKTAITILPDLKSAIKNALTGLYKKTTKNGANVEIKIIKGKKVNETRKYKSGRQTTVHFDSNGNIIKNKIKYADGILLTEKYSKDGKILFETSKKPKGNIITNYYNNKESLIKSIEKDKEGITVTSHFDDNEKIIRSEETDKKGTIVETTEYYYHPNQKLAEMTTRFGKHGVYTEKYNDKYILISSESIQGNSSQKNIYDENNYLMHKIEKLGNGSFYSTDYWKNGGLKKFTASHRGLTITEDYASDGILTHMNRIFRGNNFDAYTNKNGIFTNGMYRTKDGQSFQVSYNEMGAFTDLTDKTGQVVDSNDFIKWYEDTEPKEIEISKHAHFDIPDVYPDDYESSLFEHIKIEPEKELISEDKPSIIKEYLLNKFKPANQLIPSQDDFFKLHHN